MAHSLRVSSGLPWAGFCRWCARPVPACVASPERRRDFEADGACAWCRALAGPGPDGARACGCVVQGTVVGVVSCGPAPCELALMPFTYDGSRGAFAWELHHLVRAGDSRAGLRALVELAAVCDAPSAPDVRVQSLASCRDPLVSARLACNRVVVALTRRGVVLAGELFPSVDSPPSFAPPWLVDLEEAVPWAGGFGYPLFPLDDFLRAEGLDGVVGSAEDCDQSALRQAALVARLLELAVRCNLVERWLLAGRRPPTDDSSDEVV